MKLKNEKSEVVDYESIDPETILELKIVSNTNFAVEGLDKMSHKETPQKLSPGENILWVLPKQVFKILQFVETNQAGIEQAKKNIEIDKENVKREFLKNHPELEIDPTTLQQELRAEMKVRSWKGMNWISEFYRNYRRYPLHFDSVVFVKTNGLRRNVENDLRTAHAATLDNDQRMTKLLEEFVNFTKVLEIRSKNEHVDLSDVKKLLKKVVDQDEKKP